jgi:CheY-like chemotaxis protein
VSGCVIRPGLEVAEVKGIVRRIEVIDWWLRFDGQTKETSILDGLFVKGQVVVVERHRHPERALGGGHAGDVIDVGVGQQDRGEPNLFTRRELEQAGDFIARIDQYAVTRSRAGDDKTVFEEWADGLRLDYDHNVILAILDDLLFTSKMRATAKQIGATLAVAKSRDAALAEMRAQAPSLVIFDLNNPRTDPLGIVADMKGDAALAAIPTVGFVSHVHTELIDAARKAGVSDVMARSLFAERLPQILAKGI